METSGRQHGGQSRIPALRNRKVLGAVVVILLTNGDDVLGLVERFTGYDLSASPRPLPSNLPASLYASLEPSLNVAGLLIGIGLIAWSIVERRRAATYQLVTPTISTLTVTKRPEHGASTPSSPRKPAARKGGPPPGMRLRSPLNKVLDHLRDNPPWKDALYEPDPYYIPDAHDKAATPSPAPDPTPPVTRNAPAPKGSGGVGRSKLDVLHDNAVEWMDKNEAGLPKLLADAKRTVDDLTVPRSIEPPIESDDDTHGSLPAETEKLSGPDGYKKEASESHLGPYLGLDVVGLNWSSRSAQLKVSNRTRSGRFTATARILGVEGGTVFMPVPQDEYGLTWSLARSDTIEIRHGDVALLTVATLEKSSRRDHMLADLIRLVSAPDNTELEVIGGGTNQPPIIIALQVTIVRDNMKADDSPKREIYAVEGKWEGGIIYEGSIRIRKQRTQDEVM